MAEVKYNTPHSPEERISRRLRNSGGDLPASVRTKHGEGPLRAFDNVFHSGSQGSAGNRQWRDDEGGGGNG